jgi:hypothetical protein
VAVFLPRLIWKLKYTTKKGRTEGRRRQKEEKSQGKEREKERKSIEENRPPNRIRTTTRGISIWRRVQIIVFSGTFILSILKPSTFVDLIPNPASLTEGSTTRHGRGISGTGSGTQTFGGAKKKGSLG